MFLAMRELRRAKGRFALLIGAVALVVFLILVQQALRDSLVDSFVGGIRNSSAPVLVLDVDGRRFLQGSTITPELEWAVRGVDGIDAVARIGQGAFAVTAGGRPRSVAVVGYDTEGLGSPADLVEGRLPTGRAEVVANAADASLGFRVGDRLVVPPTGLELVVVGRAAGAGLNVTPTVYGTWATYVDVLRTRNADTGDDVRPNALAVRQAGGLAARELAARINAASPTADALTARDAADGNPGVVNIERSFGVIFLLFGIVLPLVTGLFFLILTQQKQQSLTLLRAFGAPASRLSATVLYQAVFVLAAALALGTAAYWLISLRSTPELTIPYQSDAVVAWSVVLGALGMVSAAASVRRVRRLDPLAAQSNEGLDR
ncbi:MAG TPA: FtsX-like permease family protein [Mycobacteriales bacterium]|nr:FtsX-like permease family protein [Mycobacteriales bacterium]